MATLGIGKSVISTDDFEHTKILFGENIKHYYLGISVSIKVGKNESVDWDFLSRQSSQSTGVDSLL